ncbi:GNAT family N-acetyltransferase [Nocardia sp. NBC_01329]|uniref:GNAT family N-acetyltransferase n=1 Tax=Nocardia sp. NBC_01329 TaxID=2903594 RepID=UPI002E0D8F79|nr:GNAT family N-acetyltransferase [Nocardia sp. NBC_01329]
MKHSPLIRPAVDSDIDAASETLAKAFSDYPFTRYTVDSRDHQDRVRQLQRLYLTDIGMRCGRVWVADDASAVAVWTTPSSTGVDDAFGRIAARVNELHGDRAAATAQADELIAPLRPTEPVWFLATVGVDPDVQGRGLGRAVLEPGLDAARSEGVPVYLETSSESNLGFYRQFGFEVVGSVDLPDGGPRTWAMRNDVLGKIECS